VKVGAHRFQVVGAADHKPLGAKELPENEGGMSRMKADEMLSAYLAKKPAQAGKVMVIPIHDAAEANA